MFNLTTIKVAKNTIYQLIGKLVSMSITVLITVLVTRNYGPEGYGRFSLMQSFPALFFIIVDFGLNAISVREAAKDETKIYSYFVNVLILRLALAAFFMSILGVLLHFFPYDPGLIFGIRLSLFLIFTQALYSTTNIIFQYKLRYDLSALGMSGGYLFILGTALYLVSRSSAVVWINFTYVLGGILTFLINFYLIHRLDIDKSFEFDFELIKELFYASLPLGIMFVFSQMNFKEDALLISILRVPEWLNMTKTEAVGVYSLPYKVFEVSLVIPTFFMNAVYPILVRHMQCGKDRLKGTFSKSILFLFGGGIVVGMLGIVFAPWIIEFLGGSDFAQSVSVLRILVGGVFIFYLTQPFSWLIITLGKQKYLPYIYFFSVILNLTFNLIFIPRYSFYAAAGITVISEFFILLLLFVFARKAWREKYAL